MMDVKKQGYFAPSEFAVLPEEPAHDDLKMANLLMSGAVKFTNCNVSVSEVLGIQIKGEDVVHMYEKPPKKGTLT